jgi:tetratricopeptide (TPR) repeat protein
MLLSSRFVCAMDDLGVGPEDFAITVAAQLYEHVMQEERNRAMALSGPISGWDHMLRAMAFAIRSGLEQARSAVEEARLAVAAAPDLGLAHAWFAFAKEVVGRLFSIHDESRIRQTHAHIQQAMQLDGDNPAVLSLLAQTYGQMEDGETALRLALRATGLHPNSPDAQFALAGAYFAMGRVIEVIAASEKYIRISPPDAVPPMVLQQRGLCLCLDGRPDEAEPVLDRTLALNPQFGPTLRWKAIAAAQQSKEGAAHEAMARLRQAEPGLSGEEHVCNMQRVPAMVPHMTEAIATFRRLWDETGGDGCRP